jgi:uracil-DNA glycosylase
VPGRRGSSLTRIVADWRAVMAETRSAGGPVVVPLPHPSWRNNAWLKRHPWFEAELLPVLRREIAARL